MRESDPFVRVLVCVFSFISTTKVVYECECVVGGLSVSSVNDFVFFFSIDSLRVSFCARFS